MSSTTKTVLLLGAAFTAVAGVVAGINSYKIVPPQNFGVEVIAGKVQDKLLAPGFHKKYPIFDDINVFNNNVIILESVVGGNRNTQDQNSFTGEMRLHYQIDPNAGVLAFHMDEMSKDNGRILVTEQMNKAMNAVVGARSTGQVLSSHAEVLKAFIEQLEWRLKQNNIAVKIDTVEYLTANMGNGVRLPVQLRIKPGQAVESMAGPSAVPVTTSTAPAKPAP